MDKEKRKTKNLKQNITALHRKIKFQKTVIDLKSNEICELKEQKKRLEKALADATDHIIGK